MNGLLMKYFVLKPSGNDIYAEASRRAMRAYANFVENENPQLSKELKQWADDEFFKTEKVKNFPPKFGE